MTRSVLLACSLSISGALVAAAQDNGPSQAVSAALLPDWEALSGLSSTDSTPVAAVLAAHALMALNRGNEAIRLFEHARPDDLDAWERWTGVLVKDHGNRPMARYFRGDALARLGRFEEAIEQYSAGLNLSGKHPFLLHGRGVCFAAAGRLDEAMADLTDALRNRPDIAEFHSSVGSLWIQRKTGAVGARQRFDRALQLSPDHLPALYSRWALNMIAGNFRDADADYDRAIAASGDLEPALLSRFDVVRTTFLEGQREYTELALAAGDNPGAHIRRVLSRTDLPQATTAAVAAAMYNQFPEHRAAIASAISESRSAIDLGKYQQVVARFNQVETRLNGLSSPRAVSARDIAGASATVTRDVSALVRNLQLGVRLFPKSADADSKLLRTGVSTGLRAFQFGLEWQHASFRDQADAIRDPFASYRLEAAGKIGLNLLGDRLKANFGLARSALPVAALKAAPDLVAAAATHIGAGQMTMDTARQYSRGFAKLSGESAGFAAGYWVGLRTLATTRNPRLAFFAYQSTSALTSEFVQSVAAPTLERATQPAFEAAGRYWGLNLNPQFTREFDTLRQSAIARGLPVPTRQGVLDGSYVRELRALPPGPPPGPPQGPPPGRPPAPLPAPDVKPLMNAVKPMPAGAEGGIRTGSQQPLWPDGQWPAVPWYGSGYPAMEKQQPSSEVKQ